MSTLTVRLFGRIDIRYRGRELRSLQVRKVQELVSYLLCYRDRPHARETLAAVLWGDISTAQSKRYLRKALWQLQSTLQAEADPPGRNAFLVEPEWVQVNPEASLWIDVAAFEHAYRLVHGVPGSDLDSRRALLLRSAVELYHGDLLDGWYEDWCLYERERLQHMYLAMLDKLLAYSQVNEDYELGLMYGLRILRYEPARERTHRRLMRLHYLAGNRTAALRQYDRCLAALDAELGVGPARRTVELRGQIQDDTLGSSVPTSSTVNRATESSASALPELLGRLSELHAILDDAQQRLQRDIRAVQQALPSDRTDNNRAPDG
jgi:DNA-binding SARP family transcriptional activator